MFKNDCFQMIMSLYALGLGNCQHTDWKIPKIEQQYIALPPTFFKEEHLTSVKTNIDWLFTLKMQIWDGMTWWITLGYVLMVYETQILAKLHESSQNFQYLLWMCNTREKVKLITNIDLTIWLLCSKGIKGTVY